MGLLSKQCFLCKKRKYRDLKRKHYFICNYCYDLWWRIEEGMYYEQPEYKSLFHWDVLDLDLYSNITIDPDAEAF